MARAWETGLPGAGKWVSIDACMQQGGWGCISCPRLVRGPGESPQGLGAGYPSFGALQRFWASPHLGCRICPQGGLEAQGLAQAPQCLHIMLGPRPVLGHSQEEGGPGPRQVILSAGAGLWLQTGLSGFNAVGGPPSSSPPPRSHCAAIPFRTAAMWLDPRPAPSPRAPRAPLSLGTVPPARNSEALGSRQPLRTLQLSWRRPRGGGLFRQTLCEVQLWGAPGSRAQLGQALWDPLPEWREEETGKKGKARGRS